MQTDYITLLSGSSGNASVITGPNGALLIDAGAPCRSLTAALQQLEIDPQKLQGIVITHDHVDHTSGAGAMARRYRLPVYATEGSWSVMGPKIGKLPEKSECHFRAGDTLTIGDFCVHTFATPHDAAEPVGLCIDSGGPIVGILTDVGHADTEILEPIKKADVLLIEANHDVDMLLNGMYPPQLKARILGENGHLSNEDCGKALTYLVRAGLPCAVLGHLSSENNTPTLAVDTVAHVLRQAGIEPGKDMILDLAPRFVPGRRFRING